MGFFVEIHIGVIMEPSTKPQTASVAVSDPVDPVLKSLKAEPHRPFTPEDLVRLLNPKVARDPQKLSEAAQEFRFSLNKLVEAGSIREIESGVFKARLFFDKEERIEHAFIGGMGNTLYSFKSSIFRLNIGVLSVYFIKDQKKSDWVATVRDTTTGKDYCLACRLRDGSYVIGNRPPESGEDHHLQIKGRYINKKHVTITIAGDKLRIEDHKTLNGTRIDHFTEEGLAQYRDLAKKFLKQAGPSKQRDIVKRGRFVLEQLLQHHQNFEVAFFGAVVDSVIINE